MKWRKNRIAMGALAFFALLGLTLWAVSTRNRQPNRAGEIPSVEIDQAAITTLEIVRPGETPTVLSKVEDAWRVTAPVDAPADSNNVKSALNRLADLKITRIVATKPENYARLEVDGEHAVRVTAKGADDALAELMIGKYGNGVTMLRVGDRPEVFGARGSLRYAFDRELKSWRDRKVVDVDAASILSIRFESANGTFEFQREGEGWTAVHGKKVLKDFDRKQLDRTLSTVTQLVASGFAPDDTSPARAGLTEPEATVIMTLAEDPNTIVLELGDTTEGPSELYLRRSGNPTIYVISEYLANRLQPDEKAFQAPTEPPAPQPPTNAPPRGAQQPQLPPEVMKQLQEQIRAQQQQRAQPP